MTGGLFIQKVLDQEAKHIREKWKSKKRKVENISNGLLVKPSDVLACPDTTSGNGSGQDPGSPQAVEFFGPFFFLHLFRFSPSPS